MPSPPPWARRNAGRTFDLVKFDAQAAAQRIVSEYRGRLTPRNFKRAALAIKSPRILARGPDKLLGWRPSLLVEDDSDFLGRSISLAGFSPFYDESGFGFRYSIEGVVLHIHAVARLFERAIQPPEAVAASLLDPQFMAIFSNIDSDDGHLGFAVPFQGGRFVGSIEHARGIGNRTVPIFDIRTWLPNALDGFAWTGKASRTHLLAMEVGRRNQAQQLLETAQKSSVGSPDDRYFP